VKKIKKPKKKRNPLKLSDQTRTRREFIDYDYVDKLSPEEQAFLAKFTDEYYGGAVKKGCKTDLHYSSDRKKYRELRTDCYNRNNRQNQDVYGLSKTCDKLDLIDDHPIEVYPEDALNELIDIKLTENPPKKSSNQSDTSGDDT